MLPHRDRQWHVQPDTEVFSPPPVPHATELPEDVPVIKSLFPYCRNVPAGRSLFHSLDRRKCLHFKG